MASKNCFQGLRLYFNKAINTIDFIKVLYFFIGMSNKFLKTTKILYQIYSHVYQFQIIINYTFFSVYIVILFGLVGVFRIANKAEPLCCNVYFFNNRKNRNCS